MRLPGTLPEHGTATGLSGQMFRHLIDADPTRYWTPTELAAMFDAHPNRVRGLLHGLERRGIVEAGLWRGYRGYRVTQAARAADAAQPID